jgi:2-polyprenyl-3-methyl-5-hydroxy-6-metoxy-1,4-benzoquinol methylase
MITDSYRKINEDLHAENAYYGTSGVRYVPQVQALALSMQTQDILDYGCGKSTLAQNLPYKIKQYDPAIKKYAALPKAADLLVCTDVLEHIEPEKLEEVLGHMRDLTKSKAFLTVATREAKKTLSDGRNAHLIVEKPVYWFNKISEYFNVQGYQDLGGLVLFVVGKK